MALNNFNNIIFQVKIGTLSKIPFASRHDKLNYRLITNVNNTIDKQRFELENESKAFPENVCNSVETV